MKEPTQHALRVPERSQRRIFAKRTQYVRAFNQEWAELHSKSYFQQHPFQSAAPLQVLAFGMLAPQEKRLRILSFTANLE